MFLQLIYRRRANLATFVFMIALQVQKPTGDRTAYQAALRIIRSPRRVLEPDGSTHSELPPVPRARAGAEIVVIRHICFNHPAMLIFICCPNLNNNEHRTRLIPCTTSVMPESVQVRGLSLLLFVHTNSW